MKKSELLKKFPWEDALTFLKQKKRVSCLHWNGLTKQKMFIAVQFPDENSFMTEPYTYMQIEKEDGSVIRVPWFPSRLDTFSDQWIVLED